MQKTIKYQGVIVNENKSRNSIKLNNNKNFSLFAINFFYLKNS